MTVLRRTGNFLTGLTLIFTAFIVHYFLNVYMDDTIIFGVYFIAIAISMVVADTVSSIAAAVIAFFLINWFFIEPRYSFKATDMKFIIGLTNYAATCTVIIYSLYFLKRERLLSFESTKRLQITLNSIGDAVITTDVEGNILSMNPVAEELTQWSSSEAKGKPLESIFMIVNEHTLEPVSNPVQKVLQSGRVVGLGNHTALIRRDNSIIPILDSAAPIQEECGNILGVILVFHDVAKEKESESLLRLLINSMPVLISYVDSDMHYRFINEQYETWFNQPRAEIEGKHIRDVIGESAYQTAYQHVKRVLSGEEVNFEAFIQYKHRGERCILAKYVPHKNPNGTISGFFALVQDITEKKKSELDLQQREEDFRLIFELAGSGKVQTDPNDNFKLIRVNKKYSEITGYTEEELLKMSIRDLTHPDDREQEEEHLNALLNGETIYWTSEKRCIRKTGEPRWVYVTGTLQLDENGKPYRTIATVQDIHQRKVYEFLIQYLADTSSILNDITNFNSSLQTLARRSVPLISECMYIAIGDNNQVNSYYAFHCDASGGTQEGIRNYDMEALLQLPIVQQAMIQKKQIIVKEPVPELSVCSRKIQSIACCPITTQEKAYGVIMMINLNQENFKEESNLIFLNSLCDRVTSAWHNHHLYLSLKEADQKKDEFLAMLAHELRNPLAAISSGLRLLFKPVTPGKEERSEWLREMLPRQVSHLT
ncbi:MAG: PAS domain S-box protein [bacterium]